MLFDVSMDFCTNSSDNVWENLGKLMKVVFHIINNIIKIDATCNFKSMNSSNEFVEIYGFPIRNVKDSIF